MSKLHIFSALVLCLLLFSCATNKRKEEERLRRILEASASFHIEKAYAATESGNYDVAMTHLYKALKLAPWEPAVHNNLGVIHYHRGNLDSAIYYYKGALRVQPTYIHSYINMAQAYVDRGEYKLAHLVINNGIQYNPKEPKLYIVRASVYEKEKLTDEAILNYKRALVLDPDNDAVYNNLGVLYQSKGMLSEAIEYFQKSIELNPNNAESYFNLGNAFARRCQLEEAAEHFTRAIELRPNLYSGYNNRGLVYMSMNKPDAALADFEKALDLNPDANIILFNLSIAYERMDSLEKSMYYINRALAADSGNATYYVQKGGLLARQDKLQEALSYYEKASALDASLPIVYNNMGNTYSKIGEAQKARKAFEKAVELFPEFLESRYFTLARSRQAGQVDLVASCEEYTTLATDFAGIYNNLGKAHLQMNNQREALNAFKRAAEIQPNLAESYQNLAAVYQLMGDSDTAQLLVAQSRLVMANNFFELDSLSVAHDLTTEALRLNPSLQQAMALLGLIYEKEGKIDKARRSFQSALAMGSTDSEFDFAYGEFLSRQGEWEKALSSFSEGLRKMPNSIRGHLGMARALKESGREELAGMHRAQVHFLRGKRFEYAGQWDAALDEYTTATTLDSGNADYFAAQGLIFAKKHDHQTAQLLFDNALKLDAQNAMALYGMGLVLGDQQRHEEAVDYLERSLLTMPNEAQVHYVLAVNYYFLNRIDKAWQHVRRAQELGKLVKQEFIEELQRASKAQNE